MPSMGKVYVIDDDEAMRDSLSFLLEAAGFDVTLFESALKFLDALPGLAFGCVVSDVRMPGLDGIELLKRMKVRPGAFPIIIMTGRFWMAQYEWYAHKAAALQNGVKPEIVDAIANGRRPSGMPRDIEVAYNFIDELLTTHQVTDTIHWKICDSVTLASKGEFSHRENDRFQTVIFEVPR